MVLGVDYSSGRPSPAEIKRRGYGFVCRYLAPLTSGGKQSWKELRASERDALLKAGLPIVLVFESTAGRALEGKSAGRADGRTATQRADALHVPAGVCVYVAIDTDISSKDYAKIDAYFDGFRETLRTDLVVGGYGEYDALNHLFAGERIAYGWQTAAWSGGKKLKKAALYQRAESVTIDGVTCDVDELLKSNYGAWREGDDMAKADDELHKEWGSKNFKPPGEANIKGDTYRDRALRETWGHVLRMERKLDDFIAEQRKKK
jgi:hypothetical protein